MRIRWRGLELPSKVACDYASLTGTYGKFVAEPFEQLHDLLVLVHACRLGRGYGRKFIVKAFESVAEAAVALVAVRSGRAHREIQPVLGAPHYDIGGRRIPSLALHPANVDIIGGYPRRGRLVDPHHLRVGVLYGVVDRGGYT